MIQKTFFVTFFLLRARTSKTGLTPILARITTNGISKRFIFNAPSHPKSGIKPKNGRREKTTYASKSMPIRIITGHGSSRAQRELQAKGYERNAVEIKEYLSNSVSLSVMVLAEFAKYCDKRQKEVGERITQLKANKYHRLLRYVREYTLQQYNKEDLPVSAISYEYLDGLNTFMQTAHECKNNGAINLWCCLKNFILYAIRNEWIEKNPFKYYKMKIDKTNVKTPLTKAELDTLIQKPMPNERLVRIRDVFAFVV